MRETDDNEDWKLLNLELRDAREEATTRQRYPMRTRFDQEKYDRLAAAAWMRYRQRVEARRCAAGAVALPADPAAVRFVAETADTDPVPL
jgi:hypothetical protein